MSTTQYAAETTGALAGEIDATNGTIYVFDPPPGAVHGTVLDRGSLCYATYADDRIVDVGALQAAGHREPGDCAGWVSPRCLRLATDEECAGVTIPVFAEPEEDEAWFYQVHADPNGYGQVFTVDMEGPGGWTDTGFRRTHAQCVTYLGF